MRFQGGKMSEVKVAVHYTVDENAIAKAVIITTKMYQKNGETRYSAEAELENGTIIPLSAPLYQDCVGHTKKGFVDVKGDFFLQDIGGQTTDSVPRKRLDPYWQQRIDQFDNILDIFVGQDGLKPMH